MRYHRDLEFPGGDELTNILAPYIGKLLWFLQRGYKPHPYQMLFHCNTDPVTELLARFRMEAAGRRGGKTLGAAWDTSCYLQTPHLYWREFKGTSSNDELHWWILGADMVVLRPTRQTFLKVLKQQGLEIDKDFNYNRANSYIEFKNGSLVEFKSCVDPLKLVGAGLHGQWWDEASKIPTDDAWQTARPTLSDHQGMAMFTMTPEGKNWAWEQFWGEDFKELPSRGTVEFYSIDNTYFPEEEWLDAKRDMHPMMFKQEYMASFDAMQGKDLHGDWLHYYLGSDLPDDLVKFIGVDPSISQKQGADEFAITCIGISKSSGVGYILDQWAGRLPFPEQVEMLHDWHTRHRPEMIGVEAVAYQAALVQQTINVYNYLPLVPMFAPGTKATRIIGMSSLFRLSRILCRKDQTRFIDQWLDYDSSKTHPKDDILDSVEIALRTAGALLPYAKAPTPEPEENPDPLVALADKHRKSLNRKKNEADEFLGNMW